MSEAPIQCLKCTAMQKLAWWSLLLQVKVDLTKYVERHCFAFDDALPESVSNDAVYRSTVQPLVATIFRCRTSPYAPKNLVVFIWEGPVLDSQLAVMLSRAPATLICA